MEKQFNIAIRKEWNYFVARVLENNVSSFGKTYDEALIHTKNALELYYENEKWDTQTYSINPTLVHYTMKYAESVQSEEGS